MTLGGRGMTIDPDAPRMLFPESIRENISLLRPLEGQIQGTARDAVVAQALAVTRDAPPGWSCLVDALLVVMGLGTCYLELPGCQEALAGIEGVWRSRTGGIEVHAGRPLSPYELGAVSFSPTRWPSGRIPIPVSSTLSTTTDCRDGSAADDGEYPSKMTADAAAQRQTGRISCSTSIIPSCFKCAAGRTLAGMIFRSRLIALSRGFPRRSLTMGSEGR